MAAYVVVQIDIHDEAMYARYREMAPPSIAKYGGKYIVRGGKSEILEGDWQPSRLVILEFPDIERAKAWWASPEYSEARAVRQGCADAEMLVIEGIS
jgi:uncharacterized protein (DUF1330 family)